MRALRRVERLRWLWVPRFAAQSPALREALSQQLVDADPGAAAAALRRLAVEVARRAVRGDLEDLHSQLPDLDPEVAKRRRTCILQRSQELAPG